MTYKRFLRELKALRGKYCIDKNGMIRARFSGTGYCPIAGVSVAHGGPDSISSLTTRTGNALNLTDKTRITIVDAADFDRVSNPRVRRVRRDLLRVLDLVERKA